MEDINKCLVKVPDTEKTISPQELFKQIKLYYDGPLDSIDGLTRDIDSVIRFIAEHITNDTYLEDLSSSFFTLYRLRDVFENMEVK